MSTRRWCVSCTVAIVLILLLQHRFAVALLSVDAVVGDFGRQDHVFLDVVDIH